MWNFLEFASWFGQQGIWFRPSLDGARLSSSGSFGEKIERDDFEESVAEFLGFALGSGARHGGVKGSRGVEGSLEADAMAWHAVAGGRLGFEAADEVVGDQIGEEFLARHGRGAAPKLFHRHGGLQVAESKFNVPTHAVEFGDAFEGIDDGIEQGGGDPKGFGAKSVVLELNAEDAHLDGSGQSVPFLLLDVVGPLNGPRPCRDPV